jgi:uncharacterized protein YbaR (Trm112 family)
LRINDQLPTAVVFNQKSSIFNQQSAISNDVMPCRTMLDMIAKDLLEILVCPACKQGLEYRQNPESLKCTACHRVYAVKDDIPIMLVDQATVETS